VALTYLNPPGLADPSPYGYSQIAIGSPGSRPVFIAGQGGFMADGTLPSGFREQVRQALANLATALKAAGATMAAVGKLTVYIVDHNPERLGVFHEEFFRFIGGPGGPQPAATLVPVPALAVEAMLFEIDAIAAV
jgi:enamine deaminase RidA (YjgF/YER057c/UK114 family)